MVWNSLRFKPPPTQDDTSMGWRIEFRPMEVFITISFYSIFFIIIVLLASNN
jgi:glutamate--cysteine ligase catalytic subunit